MQLKKEDKTVIKNIGISLITLFFAISLYVWLTRYNRTVAQTIFEPALTLSNWISLIVFVFWFVSLVLLYKYKLRDSKMSESKKIAIGTIYNILVFWLVFFFVDWISANTQLNEVATAILQLDTLLGIIIFGVWFVGLVKLIQNQKKFFN